MVLRVKPVLLLSLLLLLPAAYPVAASQQQGTYTAVNPWDPSFPDCEAAPRGASVGLGGACFVIPPNMTDFRVTLHDAALGPGYGAVNLCEQGPSGLDCHATPICGGVAEGLLPSAVTRASVVTYDALGALTFCGSAGLAWAPTHGTATLTLWNATA